jgi:hypothetical protein
MFELALDICNILGGILLLVSGGNMLPVGKVKLSALALMITPYKLYIGIVVMVVSLFFAIRHFPGIMIFEICGLLVGLILIDTSWKKMGLPGVWIYNASRVLIRFQAYIGVVAIVIGLYGLIAPN